MRVLRSSLLVAAAAFVAAACGDKVNIVQPSNQAITSVQVAPSTATISVGQSVTLTAAVNAAAGVTPTVTWSTSSSAAATVSQSGVVLGVLASPGVAICATATSGSQSLEGCATVVVQPATQVVPAVLQIASVTVAGNLNNPVATPPGTMGGQVNVSVNLNPGTEHMDSVIVQLNGKTAATQTFTDAQAAALRSATGSGADQALQSTLVFAVNTAAYNGTTGATTFPNGPATFVVIGYGKQSSSPATNSVTSQGYLLFNADAWILTQTLGAGTNTATSAAGFVYQGGPTASVAVSAIPVSYSGLAIASANVNYGTALCGGAPQRVTALVAPTAPAVAWTATFARTGTGTAHAVDVNGYEFNGAACAGALAAGGEGAAIANSLYANNTSGPTGFANANPAPLVRLDNKAPGTPSLVQNPRIRQNDWINAQVGVTAFNNGTFAGSTANNLVTAGTADLGVGGDAAWVRAAAPGAGNIVDPALVATAVTAPTVGSGTFAPTLTNLSLCGVWTERDLLGNESALPAAGTVCSPVAVASNTLLASNTMLLGVDIAPPTIAIGAGSIVASTAGVGSTGANVGGEFQVSVLDTGIVGNSGMQATSPVIGTVTIRTAAAGLTAAQLCVVGTVASGVCTATSTGFAAPAFPLVSTNTLTAQTVIGYYTFVAQSVDAAGNLSTNTVTSVRTYNPAANVPALTASLFNTPLTGPTATFTATGSSGNTTVNGPTTFFDLWKVSYNLTYAGGFALPIVYPSTIVNTFNVAPEVNSNVPIAIAITGFIRQAEAVTSACNAALTTGGTNKPTQLQEALLDQVSNTSGAVNTAIPGASVAAGVAYTAFVPATQQVYTFIDGNGVVEQPTAGGCPLAAGANSGVKVSIGGTSVDPTAVTLKADVWGPTATFNPPFAQVNFYVKVNATLELIGSTTTYATTDDGSAQGRKHSYTFSWTPGSKTPVTATTWAAAGYPGTSSAACAGALATNLQVYAVGVSAAGDALIAPVNANICDTNAP
jgi:hypothetical protein